MAKNAKPNVAHTAATLLRDLANAYASAFENGDKAEVVRKALRTADRLEGRPEPRTRRITALAAAALALGAALAGPADAREHKPHVSYADASCADLRAQKPEIKGPIAVTCHFPVATKTGWDDRPVMFRCPALPGGETMTPIDAETSSFKCGAPFR